MPLAEQPVHLPSIPCSGVALVRSTFQQAAAAGLNVVRTFAHTTDPAYPLQARLRCC